MLKLAPDLVTTAPSVRTQVDCLYEVPDVGQHGALVQVLELTGVSVRVVDVAFFIGRTTHTGEVTQVYLIDVRRLYKTGKHGL